MNYNICMQQQSISNNIGIDLNEIMSNNTVSSLLKGLKVTETYLLIQIQPFTNFKGPI